MYAEFAAPERGRYSGNFESAEVESLNCAKRLEFARGASLATNEGVFHDIGGHEDLTRDIIGCAIRVHEALGPGLLESVYKPCLVIEMRASGFAIETTRRINLTYRGQDLDAHYCPDIIVNDAVIVELKAVDALARVHQAQVITYLKLTHLPVGLLINFNVDQLTNGVRRVVRPDLYVRTPTVAVPK